MLAACLCIGLGLSLVLREARLGLALAALALGGLALAIDDLRLPLLAAALLIAGAWWGGVRLEALDSSALVDELDRAALVRVEVTGPARRSEFALRVPVRVRRFGDLELDERPASTCPGAIAASRAPSWKPWPRSQRLVPPRRPEASTRRAISVAKASTSFFERAASGSSAAAVGWEPLPTGSGEA